MRILLPENESPEVARYMETNPEGVVFDNLSIEDSIEMLKSGEVDGVIVGAEHSSVDVIRAGIELLGTVDGLVSSFFIMKKEGEEPIFYADCAVNPSPDEEMVKTVQQMIRET